MHTFRLAQRLQATAFAAFIALAFAGPAIAKNAESLIKSRSEFSEFNDLLARTGNVDLISHGGYTVFVPINGSFAPYPTDRYPYLYGATLTDETSQWANRIARNHIVRGPVYFDGPTRQKGGLYSVDGRFLAISESPHGTYWVDGHKVVNMFELGSGVVYAIDGLIAKPWEMTELLPAPATGIPAGSTTIIVPPGTGVTVEQNTDSDGTTTTTVSPH